MQKEKSSEHLQKLSSIPKNFADWEIGDEYEITK